MTAILIAGIIIVLILLWKRVKRLEKTLEEVRRSLTVPYEPVPAPVKAPLRESLPQEEPAERVEVSPDIIPATEPPERTESRPPAEEPTQRVKAEPAAQGFNRDLWTKIEKQFVENWTGIIGAVVMVMGVSFLGIYAALKLKPFSRFIMITSFSGLLFASYLVLRMRSMWLKVAAWVRSSSGAIFLFACLGAGGIDGLKWVHDPLYALTLLGIGIAVNLYLGFAGGTQVFASLHVILSLLAIVIAPQSTVTLVMSGIVVLIGVLMTYRDRWEYHLFSTITAFLIYQFIWYVSQDLSPAAISQAQRFTGILVTAVIGIAACFVHYRKLYMVQTFERLPFAAHLTNWFYMTAGLILYSTGSKWNTLVLGCAAIAAFILSRYARRLQIRWLFITDSLVAESIALFALFTLNRWNVDWFMIIAMIHVEIFLFLAVMVVEKEILLRRIGVYLHCLSGAAVMVAAIIRFDYDNVRLVITNSTILLILLIIEGLFHVYSMKHRDDAIDVVPVGPNEHTWSLSLGGIIIPLYLLTFFGYIGRYLWAGPAIALLGVLLFLGRQRLQSNGLGAGLLIFLVGVHIMSWIYTHTEFQGHAGMVTLYSLPVFLISAAGITFSYVDDLKRYVRWPCIYAFTAHLILFSYFITVTISPYLPGVLWIILSALYLQVAIYLKERSSDAEEKDEPYRFVFHAGCVLILCFIIRHIMVHMQPGPYIGFFKVRLIIEILALLVLSFWAAARLPESKSPDIVWRMHPLFWELFLIFFVATVALEVPTKWHPLAWMVSGLLLFLAGMRPGYNLPRFRLYSVFLYWAACFHVAFISSSEPTPSIKFRDQAWVGGVAALLFQFFYMIILHRRNGLTGIDFPLSFGLFRKMVVKMEKRQTIWIYYPFFIAVALFLFWTFDKSVLTLLWVLESFSIFILSILLRESHFRYVSMGALSGCLVRLVFFDLAQSATLMRAVVFLGVGLMMLLMNVLYTKYRDRFSR